MTLGFKTHFANGKPTFFVEKIQKALRANTNLGFSERHVPPNFNFYIQSICKPKVHTVREDVNENYRAGRIIHPVIHNRTANRFQFAPEFPCVSTQRVFMTYAYNDLIEISIDSRELYSHTEREAFAINDGFDSWKDFFEYWYPIIMKSELKEFSGKIIHFTEFRY